MKTYRKMGLRRCTAMFILLSGLLISIHPASSQIPDSKPYRDAVSPEKLADYVYDLSSVELRGRGNGSRELTAAAGMIRKQFSAAGLTPLVPDFVHAFPLVQDTTAPTMIKIGTDSFYFSGNYYTRFFNNKKSEKASKIILSNDLVTLLSLSKKELQGKALVIVPGIYSTNDNEYDYLRSCIDAAQHAKPAMILIPTIQFQRSASLKDMNEWNAFFEGNPGINSMKIPVIYTDWNVIQHLFSPEKFTELLKQPGSKVFNKLEIDKPVVMTYRRGTMTKILYNVAGMIPGKNKEEAIVIGAHYDHIGQISGDTYYGADDNASGTAALIGMAHLFGEAYQDGIKPERSVIFVAFAGEELGLHGSAFFVARHHEHIDTITAMINMDMIGRSDQRTKKDEVYVLGYDLLSPDWKQILHEVESRMPNFRVDYRFGHGNDPDNLLMRSDQLYFLLRGIPSLFFHDFMSQDYHRPSDTPDKIDYQLLANRTKFIFQVAWQIAFQHEPLTIDKSMKLKRKPPSFR